MKFAEMMFYAEAKGLLPTRAGNINAVINEIKNDPRPSINLSDFQRILAKHGLRYEDLTEREIRYINASIG